MILIVKWLNDFNPQQVPIAEPLLYLGLYALSLSLPSSLLPHVFIWLYDKVLWSSEPLWQVVEVIAVIQLTTNFSKEVVDRIDDQPQLAKVRQNSQRSLLIDSIT